jgi:hypothetical protein
MHWGLLVRCPIDACGRRRVIKDEAIARQVSELMLEFGARLDASVEVFESKLLPDEFLPIEVRSVV